MTSRHHRPLKVHVATPFKSYSRGVLRRKGAVARSERSRRPHAHVPGRLLTLTRVASNPFLVRPEGKSFVGIPRFKFPKLVPPNRSVAHNPSLVATANRVGADKGGDEGRRVRRSVRCGGNRTVSPEIFLWPTRRSAKQYRERSERSQWKLHLRVWNRSGTASRQPGSSGCIRRR